MRARLSFHPFTSLLASLCLLASCGGPTTFESLAALEKYQKEEGYVPVGRFGDAWPAKITEERTALGEIQFTRADGTPHDYGGFAGYELKLIRLTGTGKRTGEVIVVFRSAEKQPTTADVERGS